MSRQRFVLSATAALCLSVFTASLPAHAITDPLTVCKKTVVKSLANYKKTLLKQEGKCLDKENKLAIPGPCPDVAASAKVLRANAKVKTKIASKCTVAQLNGPGGLGYRTDCAYETGDVAGREAECAALPVTNTNEFAECMKCWKGAELSEYLAILYASHAEEVCGGDLGETSPVCSDLDCAAPLPEQRNLGDNSENDCQRGIGQAGIKYLLKREKIIEKCLLKGCDRAHCLAGTCAADIAVPLQLQRAEEQKQAIINNACGGNRSPSPSAPFCCRTGTANACTTTPTTRPDCEAIPGAAVQEGKTCNAGTLKCIPAPKTITWWNNCPESDGCPGAPVTSINELIACVDSSANAIVEDLLCIQFPGYPCPVEGTPAATPTPTP